MCNSPHSWHHERGLIRRNRCFNTEEPEQETLQKFNNALGRGGWGGEKKIHTIELEVDEWGYQLRRLRSLITCRCIVGEAIQVTADGTGPYPIFNVTDAVDIRPATITSRQQLRFTTPMLLLLRSSSVLVYCRKRHYSKASGYSAPFLYVQIDRKSGDRESHSHTVTLLSNFGYRFLLLLLLLPACLFPSNSLLYYRCKFELPLVLDILPFLYLHLITSCRCVISRSFSVRPLSLPPSLPSSLPLARGVCFFVHSLVFTIHGRWSITRGFEVRTRVGRLLTFDPVINSVTRNLPSGSHFITCQIDSRPPGNDLFKF